MSDSHLGGSGRKSDPTIIDELMEIGAAVGCLPALGEGLHQYASRLGKYLIDEAVRLQIASERAFVLLLLSY